MWYIKGMSCEKIVLKNEMGLRLVRLCAMMKKARGHAGYRYRLLVVFGMVTLSFGVSLGGG